MSIEIHVSHLVRTAGLEPVSRSRFSVCYPARCMQSLTISNALDFKHGARLDRYFTLRFSIDGKQIEEALGSASEGWTVALAQKSSAGCARPSTPATGLQPCARRPRPTVVPSKAEPS